MIPNCYRGSAQNHPYFLIHCAKRRSKRPDRFLSLSLAVFTFAAVNVTV